MFDAQYLNYLNTYKNYNTIIDMSTKIIQQR